MEFNSKHVYGDNDKYINVYIYIYIYIYIYDGSMITSFQGKV